MNNTNLDEDTIKKELEGEAEELNEERLVGTSDEDDDDPSDTTPAEASELADEGEKILEEERRRKQNPDELY